MKKSINNRKGEHLSWKTSFQFTQTAKWLRIKRIQNNSPIPAQVVFWEWAWSAEERWAELRQRKSWWAGTGELRTAEGGHSRSLPARAPRRHRRQEMAVAPQRSARRISLLGGRGRRKAVSWELFFFLRSFLVICGMMRRLDSKIRLCLNLIMKE